MGIHARKDRKKRVTQLLQIRATHLTDLLLSLNYRFSDEYGAKFFSRCNLTGYNSFFKRDVKIWCFMFVWKKLFILCWIWNVPFRPYLLFLTLSTNIMRRVSCIFNITSTCIYFTGFDSASVQIVFVTDEHCARSNLFRYFWK